MVALAKHANGQLYIYDGREGSSIYVKGEFLRRERIPEKLISLTSLRDSIVAQQARAALADKIEAGEIYNFQDGKWHKPHPEPEQITLTEFEDK